MVVHTCDYHTNNLSLTFISFILVISYLTSIIDDYIIMYDIMIIKYDTQLNEHYMEHIPATLSY